MEVAKDKFTRSYALALYTCFTLFKDGAKSKYHDAHAPRTDARSIKNVATEK